MNRTLVVISFLSLLTSGCTYKRVPDCSDLVKAERQVLLTIEPEARTSVYGQPILVRASFNNSSESPAYLELNEVQENGSMREWPAGMQVCLKDSFGKVLTISDIDPMITDGRFWSSGFLESSYTTHRIGEKSCCRRPGDCVLLQPGHNLSRVIPIDRLLIGCRNVGDPLPHGNYNVQIRCGNYYSNEVEIVVLPK